jgi:hypothetical protein
MKEDVKENKKVRPYPENKALKVWIEAMGGPTRISQMWGYDESNLWRYCVGELETPLIISKFIEISEINAVRRNEIAALGRENQRLKNELDRCKNEQQKES